MAEIYDEALGRRDKMLTNIEATAPDKESVLANYEPNLDEGGEKINSLRLWST